VNWGDVPTWGLFVGAVVTFIFAFMAFRKQAEEVGILEQQVRTDESSRQVDRVLSLHAEFSTGDIAAARARFSELMWRAGEAAFGPDKCWRPTWQDIYPPSPGSTDGTRSIRFLGTYPADMGAGDHRPLHDLRKVLWCLGRINVARRDEENALDEGLVIGLLGWEVIWWKLVCERLSGRRGAILQPLRELADWVVKQKDEHQDSKWDWLQDREYNPSDDFLTDEDYQRCEASLRDIALKSGL
jgi:hypothetical protein